jgi:hypothetical protein
MAEGENGDRDIEFSVCPDPKGSRKLDYRIKGRMHFEVKRLELFNTRDYRFSSFGLSRKVTNKELNITNSIK